MSKVSLTLPSFLQSTNLGSQEKSSLIGNSYVAINLNGGDGNINNTYVYNNPKKPTNTIIDGTSYRLDNIRLTDFLFLDNKNKSYTLLGDLINNSLSIHIEGSLITPTYVINFDQCLDINIPNTNCDKIPKNVLLEFPNNQGFLVFQYIFNGQNSNINIINIFYILVNNPQFTELLI